MADAPTISVVLPTYGRPEFVDRAARSVLEQTCTDAELVVVDDCSPTPVADALAGLPDAPIPVRVVRHEENRGAPAARNTGIDAADGEFVAFIDDDDTWHEAKLERQLAAFRSSPPDVGVVYTGQRYTLDGETVDVLAPSIRGDVTRELLSGAQLGTFSTLLVRASVIEATGGLDERFPCWQDREWPIRLSRHCLVDSVPDPLVVHRMGDHGQITDDFEAKRDVAYPLFVETFRPLAAEYGPDVERRMVATRASFVAASALKAGYYGDARRFALRAVRADPTDYEGYLLFAVALGGRPLFRTLQRAKRAVAGRLATDRT
jgi:glycosyltransferase involved in cell wall biosynthesis